MKRKIMISLSMYFLITSSSQHLVKAEDSDVNDDPVGTYSAINPGGDVTASFSSKMLKNAASLYQYTISDKTYPIGTGYYFTGKVNSRGPWDYKHAYGVNDRYVFGGRVMKGEDLGNMHFGYVGRFGGFQPKVLLAAAGAVQIKCKTSNVNWYKSYFDDPNDQKSIKIGINYADNKNLPTKSSNSSVTYQSLSKTNLKTEAIQEGINQNNMSFPNGMTESQFLNQLSFKERTQIINEANKNSEEILNDPVYENILNEYDIVN